MPLTGEGEWHCALRLISSDQVRTIFGMFNKRNFACPNYDSCLSEAVAQKLSDFHCQGCPYEDEIRSDWQDIQEMDSRRVMALFAAICRNRIRPSSEPLTEAELAFLWDDGDGSASDQAGAAGELD